MHSCISSFTSVGRSKKRRDTWPPTYMRLPVNSSHGHLVTRSTRHRSTRHIRVSSHSQLVT